MIIVMEPDAGDAEIAAVEAKIRAAGLDVHISRGTERTLIGAVGDERKLDPEMFDPLPGVAPPAPVPVPAAEPPSSCAPALPADPAGCGFSGISPSTSSHPAERTMQATMFDPRAMNRPIASIMDIARAS